MGGLIEIYPMARRTLDQDGVASDSENDVRADLLILPEHSCRQT